MKDITIEQFLAVMTSLIAFMTLAFKSSRDFMFSLFSWRKDKTDIKKEEVANNGETIDDLTERVNKITALLLEFQEDKTALSLKVYETESKLHKAKYMCDTVKFEHEKLKQKYTDLLVKISATCNNNCKLDV